MSLIKQTNKTKNKQTYLFSVKQNTLLLAYNIQCNVKNKFNLDTESENILK